VTRRVNKSFEKRLISIINVVNTKGLLNHFKSIKNLINTTEKELVKISGIGPGRAKHLIEFFEKKYK